MGLAEERNKEFLDHKFGKLQALVGTPQTIVRDIRTFMEEKE